MPDPTALATADHTESPKPITRHLGTDLHPPRGAFSHVVVHAGTAYVSGSVSYTHLTLPTICSV